MIVTEIKKGWNTDFYEHCRLRCGTIRKRTFIGPRALVVLTFKEEISRIILGLLFFFGLCWMALKHIEE